ncbi:MAG TPA: hypothetical protein VFW66_02415 [Gemmatimonadales bacterium]|nr:hypothetical protein [Gemmatimonadales bacterium]
MATLNIKNLPDALYGKLQARARRQHRSLAQEVTHILTKAVQAPEQHAITELRGLGKEHWIGRDAVRHVEAERNSWD